MAQLAGQESLVTSLREALEIRSSLVQMLRDRQSSDRAEISDQVDALKASLQQAETTADRASRRAAELQEQLIEAQRLRKAAEGEASRRTVAAAELSSLVEQQRAEGARLVDELASERERARVASLRFAEADAELLMLRLAAEARDAVDTSAEESAALLERQATELAEAQELAEARRREIAATAVERDASLADLARASVEREALRGELAELRSASLADGQQSVLAAAERDAAREDLAQAVADRETIRVELNQLRAAVHEADLLVATTASERDAARLELTRTAGDLKSSQSMLAALEARSRTLTGQLAAVSAERDAAVQRALERPSASPAAPPTSGTLSIAEKLRLAVATHQAAAEESRLPILEQELRAARDRIRELEIRDGRWIPFTGDEVADRRLEEEPIAIWFQGEAGDDLDLLGSAPLRQTRHYVGGVWSPAELAPVEFGDDEIEA